jgi:hypothetical protein
VRYYLWHDHQRARAARIRSTGRDLPAGVQHLPGSQRLAESQQVVLIWCALPDSIRVEFADDPQGPAGAVGVSVGGRRHSWSASAGWRSGREQSAGAHWLGSGLDHFLEPTSLFGGLPIKATGASSRADRPVRSTDVWPEPDRKAEGPGPFARFGAYAERYCFELDAAHGVMLAASAYLDGQPFQTIHAQQMRFNSPIDAELFATP